MNHLLILLQINKKYNQTSRHIRMGNFKNINNIMNEFYENGFVLEKFLNLCTYLFNLQIFTDGNSRTIFEYMKNILYQNNYDVDFASIQKEYPILRTYFPIMYDLNEKLDQLELLKMEKHIHIRQIKKLIKKKDTEE